jgi:hypothetical protein
MLPWNHRNVRIPHPVPPKTYCYLTYYLCYLFDKHPSIHLPHLSPHPTYPSSYTNQPIPPSDPYPVPTPRSHPSRFLTSTHAPFLYPHLFLLLQFPCQQPLPKRPLAQTTRSVSTPPARRAHQIIWPPDKRNCEPTPNRPCSGNGGTRRTLAQHGERNRKTRKTQPRKNKKSIM